MKKIIIIAFLLILSPLSLSAITKEEVLNYVNNQASSDPETASLIDKYSLQFSRLINSKELEEEELTTIYDNIVQANEIIKEYGVTTKEDLDKIPESARNNVKNALYDSVLTIAQAPSTDGSTSTITINDDNTIDVVIDGSMVDKIDLSNKTFNYVGINKSFLLIIITSYLVFIISMILFIKNKKKRVLNDLLISLSTFSLVIGLFFTFFSSNINKVVSLTELFKKSNDNLIVKKALVSNSHEVLTYPSYNSKYATLKIPRLEIDEDVIFGDDIDILNNYVGHSTTSYLPGENKTIIYSVHNYKVKNLESIKNGDKILINTDYGVFTYQVNKIKIMKTNEYNNLTQNNNKETLVLYTCYPFTISLYGNQRFVVFATLIDEKWGSNEKDN